MDNSAEAGRGMPFDWGIFAFTITIVLFHFFADLGTGFDWRVHSLFYITLIIVMGFMGTISFFDKRWFVFMFIVTFFLPYLALFINHPTLYLIAMYFPFLPLYMIFRMSNPVWNWLVKAPIIIVMIIVFVWPMIQITLENETFQQYNLKGNVESTKTLLVEKLNKGLFLIFSSAKKAKDATTTTVKQSYNNSVGSQYYTGEVEKNSQNKIGVYIENLKEADPTNYDNAPITLWATIKARAYEGSAVEDNKITITPFCVADRFDPTLIKNGTIKPATPYSVTGYDEYDVDCLFPAEANDKGKIVSLPYGEHTVSFGARFNFITKAYKKVYFADADFKRSLDREGIDIYSQYGLEKSPRGVYTNGPIEIGFETTDLVSVETGDQTRKPSVGFSLKNKLGGELVRIKRISLNVPTGLTLNKDSCNKEFELLNRNDAEGYSIYNLKGELKYDKNTNIDLQSFRCQFEVDPNWKESLLNGAPINTRYFKVETEYDYVLYGSKPISVKRGP